jgi:hypothetical protein
VGIGGCQLYSDDDSRPAPPKMDSKLVEDLLAHLIEPEGRFLGQSSTAVGSSKAAYRYWETVDQGHLGAEVHPAEQVLPEHLLYSPEVGCLTAEGGAVDPF